MDTQDSGSSAANYSNPSFTKREAGYDVLAGKKQVLLSANKKQRNLFSTRKWKSSNNFGMKKCITNSYIFL